MTNTVDIKMLSLLLYVLQEAFNEGTSWNICSGGFVKGGEYTNVFTIAFLAYSLFCLNVEFCLIFLKLNTNLIGKFAYFTSAI